MHRVESGGHSGVDKAAFGARAERRLRISVNGHRPLTQQYHSRPKETLI
jgi:hypothetical protein